MTAPANESLTFQAGPILFVWNPGEPTIRITFGTEPEHFAYMPAPRTFDDAAFRESCDLFIRTAAEAHISRE